MTRTKGSKNKVKKAKKAYSATFKKTMGVGEEVAATWVYPTPEKDDEVEELILICKVINSWGPEQKDRCLKFLFGKYKNFIS